MLRLRISTGGDAVAGSEEHVGERSLAVTANTYSHVLTSETELDYAMMV